MSIYPPTGTLEIKNATLKIPVVDLQYTSNTAKLEANSNVVTEFSRSKKLIKYPRVAMTGQTTSNYTVTGSSWYNNPATGGSGTQYEPWKAFNAKYGFQTGTDVWYSFAYTGTQSYSGSGNAFNPNHGGTATPDLFTGAVQGEWLKIQLPHKIALDNYIFTGPSGENEFPQDWTVYGSVDGTNWVQVDSRVSQKFGDGTGGGGTATGKRMNFELDTLTNEYLYFAFVFTRGGGGSITQYVGIGEIELFGIPEYDPDAHGTDVTVKSYPNVPNTDFLDVFVDAGNASGFTLSGSDVTGVTDLSTPANTMTVNGNVTYNSANKAFVFPGTGSSYMRATLVDGNGNYPLTLSVWFMITDYSGNWRSIITLGTNAPGEQASIAYDPNQDQLYFGTYGADIYVPHTPELGKWYHVAATFTGGSTTSSTMNVYLNGVNMGGVPDGTQTPSFTNNQLVIGGGMNSNGTVVNNPFKGQIGNARFYRRTYSSEEIYQLYAYQKEDFGHGDLSMTLKAGRLGIGTSEPRAALDVRGRIMREYNPGEIIEELNTVCNGRPVTVLSGTYTPSNVTGVQTSSATHTEITGSNITYNKPAGATRIYYKFACQWEDANNGALTNFKIRVFHNGDWRDVNLSRYLHSAQYVNDGNNHGSAWVINEFVFECDADTESQHDGRFLSSKTSYTFDVTWRQHGTGTGYQSKLHLNDWWDGSGTNILHPPQLTIRAIA